jgi:general stress protein YciG
MGIQNRGFAGMDREKRKRIASAGGKAAHVKGTAHEWTVSEASAAGKKGGLVSAARKQARKLVEQEKAA